MTTLASEEVAKPMYTHTPAYSWVVLIVSFLTFMCFFLALNTPSVFGTVIAEEMGIDAAQLSLFSTAAMASFTFLPLIFTSKAEAIGVKRLVPICLSLNVVSSLLLLIPWCASTFEGYVITRFIQGATGIMNGAIAAQMTRWFPKNMRGLASGLLMGFLGVGFSVASFFGGQLYDAGFTWQMSTIIMVCSSSIVMAIIYVVVIKDFKQTYPQADSMDDLIPPVPETKRSMRFESLPKPANTAEIWRSGRMWFTAIYGGITAVVIYGLGYALPQFFQGELGMDLVTASSIVAATFIWKIVASPVGGWFSDHVFKGERWQVCAIGTVIGGLLLLFILTLTEVNTISVVVILAFFFCSVYGGTYWTWPYELAQPQASYAASGFIVGISNIGGLVSVPICGLLTAAFGPSAALIFIAVVSIIGIIPAKLMRN